MDCGTLRSLTRDCTWAMAVKVLSPNHWIAREFPILNPVPEPQDT